MRLLLQHTSSYRYPRPAALGPQLIRLRPAAHARASIETYSLRVEPEGTLRWQQDPSGNRVARVTFRAGQRIERFSIAVELAVDVRPVNPFDFTLDTRAEHIPFAYPEETRHDLLPFLALGDDPAYARGPLFEALLAELPEDGETISLLIAMNQAVNQKTRYIVRDEPGIWTPEETLANGRGSCRDSAVLLIALLRARGLAARFVSGYLIQLTDEGMIPDEPKGVGRDVVDLHAWAEVYLPGGGWIGLDATSGLLCGEGHIPLACTAHPAFAAPLEGTSDTAAEDVGFTMRVGRLGHEPRPTAPFEEAVWGALLAAGDRADARLAQNGLTLTMGGEPTFNARDYPAEPEWNEAALGPTKWALGRVLAAELERRLSPGAVLLHGQGKSYPGESLPRWAIEICGAADQRPLWTKLAPPAMDPYSSRSDDGAPPTLRIQRSKTKGRSTTNTVAAERFARALAERLGVGEHVQEAFEDPWRAFQEEANLPVDVDPLKANLDSFEERRRLTRLLARGLGSPAGYVVPLAREGGTWRSERWAFRRGHLFLVWGDSPIGLRLPLQSLSGEAPPLTVEEEPIDPPDPRSHHGEETSVGDPEHQLAIAKAREDKRHPVAKGHVRTALAVEPRDGQIFVFLPPLASAGDFFDLVRAVDATRVETGIDALLEGYGPPSSPEVRRFSVTPDPGVLEVNVPVTATSREYVAMVQHVFDAALHAGLHAERYLIDGRQQGSGGGNHLTLGGLTPQQSPFVKRPDLLASLITFIQHHPSLSYLFTGLFVGPTSQAPRVDEARHDALYELEIALQRAFDRRDGEPPWLGDMLFRHLLTDLSGNTHRAEICLDKLFSPAGAHGRQGLIELRAFEMPPHPRMAVAQMLLLRALVTAFAEEPYRAPLVRFGQTLHDRYLLPYWMWKDFEEVLAYLASRDLALPHEAYRPFLELRCPVVGRLDTGTITLEARNALEPWHVLGEELTTTGTSRFVDSSMERVEVRVTGLLPERHAVLVNGLTLPLRPTGEATEYVGGVRFRAWAPPHSLHPHLGIHHPIHFDIVDRWAKRSLGRAAYHVWHPEGRAFLAPPLTRFEAAARRAQRFTIEGPLPHPAVPVEVRAHPDAPYTLDLRRYPIDRPMPVPEEDPASETA